MDFPLYVRHKDVWRAISEGVIEIWRVYNWSKKDIRWL